MEKTEDKGEEPGKTWSEQMESLPMGEQQLRIFRIAHSPVLSTTSNNGYFQRLGYVGSLTITI